MSTLEEAARRKWEYWGTDARFTTCEDCRTVLYCRRHGRSRWLCLVCWDQSEYAG